MADQTASFFDPNSNYGASYDMTTAPLGSTYLNQNWDAAFNMWGAKNGIGQGNGTQDRYYRSQVTPQLNAGFKSANAKNLNLKIEDYLNMIDFGKIQRDFAMYSPDQRGEQNAAFSPAMRTINRG